MLKLFFNASKYLLFFLVAFTILTLYQLNAKPYIFFDIKSVTDNPHGVIQLFIAEELDDFVEEKSIIKKLSLVPFNERYKFYFQDEDLITIKYLRLDPCNCEGTFTIKAWGLDRGFMLPVVISPFQRKTLDLSYLYPSNQITFSDGLFISSGIDPQIKTFYFDYGRVYESRNVYQDLFVALVFSFFITLSILIIVKSKKYLNKVNFSSFIFLFPLFYMAIIVTGVLKLWPFVTAFTRHEGPGEVLQAQILFIAAVVAFLIFIKLKKSNNLLKYLHLFIAISFFIITLEEISYGQRIFQWDTPKILLDVNLQNETTLHNIKGPVHHHDLYKIIGLYGSLSWIMHKIYFFKNINLIFFLTIPKVASLYFFSVFLFYFLFDLGNYRYGILPQVPNIQEAVELLLSLGFLIFIMRNFNLLYRIQIIEKHFPQKIN